MIRELTADEVSFHIETFPEDVPIRGNCSAVDEETDKKAEQWIRNQLRRGNEWAWCRVRVVAHWKGVEGDDHLGCCSYRSEKDFCAPDGYLPQMKVEALANLNAALASQADLIEELLV